MQNPDLASVGRDPVAVGITRPAVIRGLGVPYWHIVPILVVPFAVIFVTRNFFWFLLAPGLVLLSRSISSSDHNKARVKWLGFLAGSKNPLSRIRARKVWGGQSVDPLGSIR